MERFIDIVHVRETTTLSLKNGIIGLLAQHSLSPSSIWGQYYDGASNMQGDINGLKILMQKESKGVHSIHCFAHQLQLTLVAVSKRCDEVQELLLVVSDILNMVGSSFKRRDELRESQAEEIEEALRKGELETGRGLNQELGLARAGDTRWEKCKAKRYLKACLTFEIVFMLHFMRTILAITNELNVAFQKKEQDIANAMILVRVAKDRLQLLREKGWASLIDEVSKFCIKYDILIPNFDEPYVILGRSRRRVAEYNFFHHYHVVVFCKTIDWQFQELNNRFDEVTTELLLGVACLNPVNSFSSFDIEKILRLAKLYPDDFDKYSIVDLHFQFENYIVDVRDHDKRFFDLKGLGDLSKKLVETKKHGTYPLVFRLVKFALLLPVATATVERAFSAMKLIKTDLRNRMDDELLSGCLVPYIEKEVFSNISNEAIMDTFQNMKTSRGEL
ncbi:PREDICTED: zinc finger MYM-type protein 1-like [Nicotiana attenuata]|uniref:zinc finger MYM-type protein 1-like n=1 Tax=Nicotiana attenuata TaxID=49451 RepID=UPI000904A702|nr:PREDICTED: zinc finger MYM-type protein 1-like [Nicotiana attenuata]